MTGAGGAAVGAVPAAAPLARAALLLAGVLSGAGCEPVVRVGDGFQRLVDAPAGPVRAIDVLFVVDDSGSMAGEQEQLAASMARFAGALTSGPLGPLDLHIAVVSTDLGTAPQDNIRCAGQGDDGRFRVGAEGATCAVDGSFLIDVAAAPGSPARSINYPPGLLAETLACMTRLGTNGCGFEQPLEAARRALGPANPDAAAFLRPAALLAVFFVTDEDDCSASDRSLFDPDQDDRGAPLGELSSYRCFERGVACESPAAREVGPRTGCRPAGDDESVARVDGYIDFLRGLKSSPALVLIGGVLGDAGPVAVEEVDGQLALVDVCPSAATSASPAVRLHAVADAFPGPDATASICDADPARPASLAASAVAALVATRCLRGAPLDVEPDEAGLQPSCRAYTIAGRERRELLPCRPGAAAWEPGAPAPKNAEGDPDGPCFALEVDRGACGFAPGALALRLDGPLPEAIDLRVQLECLADPEDPEDAALVPAGPGRSSGAMD